MRAEVVFRSERLERIRVSGRDRSIVLQSNRPLLRGKGLQHRRPSWKLIEGSGNNAAVLEKIIDQLMLELDKG